ncbi:MAG: hypothetical protein IKF82_08145 [Bacilli bacterium]|nr:hypothetical protein [Bacilli bacterium]
MLSIVDKINEWIEPFNKFISKNHGNPIMWLIFVVGGLAIFTFIFDSLHKNE